MKDSSKWWKDPEKRIVVAQKISDKLRHNSGLKSRVLKKAKKRMSFSAFFSGKYRVANSGCWEFSGAKNAQGYGRAKLDGKNIGAHRASYILKNGTILNGMFVCHTCDNPSCIRPSHLFLGTHGENMIDMMKKNRGRIRFLSDEDKKEIKKLYDEGIPCNDISKQFNTNNGIVGFIGKNML
jgi:hypothetical protein